MTLTFSWQAQQIEARPGDSIAAALAAAGVFRLGESRTGRPRGVFCGMGVCQECLVIVDGRRAQRACMIEARAGISVLAQADVLLGPAAPERVRPADALVEADLAIIGAGPAGLQAAIEAARGGLAVLVIDERAETGGQYFKPRSAGYRGARPRDAQHRAGGELIRRAEASGARFRRAETVWFARPATDGPRFELRTDGPCGQAQVRARTVILAAGALERPAMVPGWTLPGVMTIGAAQTLVRRYGVAPGRRALVAGHGPLGLQLGAELLRLGVAVAAVADRGRPAPGATLARAAAAAPGLLRDGIAYRLALLAGGAPVLHGWELARIVGAARAVGAVLRRLSDGAEREIRADLICAGDGFAPQLELARLLGVALDLDPATGLATPRRDAEGATDAPGLWIAGDAGGLGGAQVAQAEGRIAAMAALRHLGRACDGGRGVRARLARARRFQSALWALYAAPPRALPADEVIVCRCEEVTAGAVTAAIAIGARDPAAIKRATRLGMGRCQARYCAAVAVRMLEAAGHPAPVEALFAPQVPARPIAVAALSIEKPEWGGHREASPAARPARYPQRPLTRSDADLVIVGAGITGVTAALSAARQGAQVVCLDRGRINGEASGGNAGSLHLQLLSWDFGGKAVAGGSPQLRTLPLQQESIALWRDLERELGADFEMKITGGLMVAETTDQIAFLEAKAAAEARMGVATTVVGPDRIRDIVPAISDRIVAAAWCPQEGKINPLLATPAIARAALAEGVIVEELTPVTALLADGGGYAIVTPRGTLRAARVLLAAGGWSAGLARHLGVRLPIRGAPLQMVVTETAPLLAPCLIAHADRHLTLKQTGAGTILIGGAWPAATGPRGQPQILAASLEGNLWAAARTIPAIGGLQVIRSWAAMNIDIDGAPLLGAIPGHPRVTVAATANGYTLGPLIGREAARIALSGQARQDLCPFSFDRFNRHDLRGKS